eukprot:655729-Alexandrium_andersonii.AAC.1
MWLARCASACFQQAAPWRRRRPLAHEIGLIIQQRGFAVAHCRLTNDWFTVPRRLHQHWRSRWAENTCEQVRVAAVAKRDEHFHLADACYMRVLQQSQSKMSTFNSRICLQRSQSEMNTCNLRVVAAAAK